VRALQPRGPFAAAVNMAFVPRALYDDTRLNAGDRIELIAPVTGG
jgi:sulfur carrier protein